MEVGEVGTKRLVLRPVEVEDAADLFAVYKDAKAVYGLDERQAVCDIDEMLELLHQHLLSSANDASLMMALELRSSTKVIGTIALHRLTDGVAEIGYQLGRSYWHKGYMSEALNAMLAIGFTKLRLHRMEARYTPQNTASARLLARCQFVQEGCLRKAVLLNDNRWHDVVVCSILKEEYENGIRQEDEYEKRTGTEIRP